VEIDGGSKNAPVLTPLFWGDYPTIKSKPSTLQQLEQSAPRLAAKFTEIANRLDDLLNDKNRKAISDILINLRTGTDVLSARSKDIDATLRNFSSASQKLDTDLADLHSTLGHADKAVDAIGDAAAGIKGLSANANTSIESAQLGELSANMRGLLGNLNRLSNQLEREPTRLLFGDRREGYTPK
jgi:phospholipid/cholesterol/gamma-HCH transport system substrate-binding protein